MLLYTGARLNEVTQLLTSDVKEIEGIPCIHIIDDPETGKRLKNKGSRRIVPIHSQLVSLGFLDYVEARRRQGDVRLFPGLDKKYVGNWYGKYLKTTGIKRRGLDMHSLRHTVVQVFKVNEVPETHAASICGHTGSATDKRRGRTRMQCTAGKCLHHPLLNMSSFWDGTSNTPSSMDGSTQQGRAQD